MCEAGKRQEEASSVESPSKEDAILLTESLRHRSERGLDEIKVFS
jgi:hypothetical protein